MVVEKYADEGLLWFKREIHGDEIVPEKTTLEICCVLSICIKLEEGTCCPLLQRFYGNIRMFDCHGNLLRLAYTHLLFLEVVVSNALHQENRVPQFHLEGQTVKVRRKITN